MGFLGFLGISRFSVLRTESLVIPGFPSFLGFLGRGTFPFEILSLKIEGTR